MASSTVFSARFLVLIACILAFSSQSLAQSTTSSASQPATTTTASIYAAASPYSYYGCWNETTLNPTGGGLRALAGGITEDPDTMTAATCIAFCKSNSYPLAGIEYTKECYCANLLSGLSNKLPDSSCDLPCAGNSSQICGGNLALTIYKQQTSTQGSGIKGMREAPVSSILALGIAIGVLLCLA